MTATRMDLKKVKEFLGKDWNAVEDRIRKVLESGIPYLDGINGMILSRKGKQLRPVISLLVSRACAGGSVTDASYRYAAASELLHNATLFHDDVADESECRRGKPTVNSMFGPTVSVLLGDYWLVKAMDCLLSEGSAADCLRVTKVFSKTLSDLAEGEMLQLEKAGDGDTTEEDYQRIIYSKTASLFEATAVSAAMSVHAPEDVEKAVGRYAVALGMAFQIRDDIFDYSCRPESIGKPVGVDIMERKMTLPLLGAMKNAGQEQEKEVRRKITMMEGHPEYKEEIIGFVKINGGIEYASSRLESYISKAVEALEALPCSEERELLRDIAYFVGERLS